MRRSLSLPITLAIVMIVLLVVLTIGWVLLNVFSALKDDRFAGVYWALLSIGTTFIGLLLAGVIVYLILSIKAINLNRRQSNFIDSVTHELKSPIASMKLYLQTLDRHHVSPEEQAGFHRFMLEDLDRLDRLINQLLDAGRMATRRPDREAENVPLDVLLADCAKTICLRYRMPVETVHFDLAPCAVRAWRIDLDILFRNVIDNAVKYAGNAPRVDVTLQLAAKGWAVVRIADNGRGIPAKFRRQIFGRFERLGSELEREKPGTGLGLYIVRNLAKRLHARVRVRAREDGPGTVFEIQLPGVVAVPGAPESEPVLPYIMAANEHILVVEDEDHLAMGIKYNLVAEGFRVTVCGDGHTALQYMADAPDDVDLVVLDLMLPGMSGYAVCEALRAVDRDIPVLILSARTLPEDRTRGFDVGANQYMSKPFELDEFVSRIRNLLAFSRRKPENRPAAPQRIATFEFAAAKIDFDKFKVVVGDEPVRMTQLEMSLLRYFVENEGRVIPRRELLEKVWDMPGNINTRAPDQFIRRLRKLFEPDPGSPRHFLTIRDAGYRFVASGETEAD